MNWGRRAVACAFLTAVAACAAPRVRPVAPNVAVHIENVPFFPDDTDQCGPSTLASLLAFWNKPTSPDVLRAEVYLPKIKGTLPMDLLPALESRGLKASVTTGKIDDLKRELQAGRPVLAYVDFGIASMPWGHYVVVTGFDAQGVYVNSSRKENAFVRYRKWEGIWSRTNHWMLVAEGPTKPERAE